MTTPTYGFNRDGFLFPVLNSGGSSSGGSDATLTAEDLQKITDLQTDVSELQAGYIANLPLYEDVNSNAFVVVSSNGRLYKKPLDMLVLDNLKVTTSLLASNVEISAEHSS